MALDEKYEELTETKMLFCEILADATSAKAVPIPFKCELVDVTVQCRATNAGGTATIKKVSTAVTDAIAMATTKAITRVGTIDTAQSVWNEGDVVTVTTNGAADRGLVTMYVRRLY